MDVRIGTLTSKVTVADGESASPELIETIVAIVLQRLRQERSSRENEEREREVRHHMAEPSRY
jgi:hypothetical protein